MAEPESLHELQLESLRWEIDTIDDQIIDLLKQRAESVESIARVKCRHQLAIYDGEREKRILEKVLSNNQTKYQAVDMASIFHAILRASLNQQLLYRSDRGE
jgi:chorismate mutase